MDEPRQRHRSRQTGWAAPFVVAALVGTSGAVAAQPAQATVLGSNGRIAYSRFADADFRHADIVTVNPDGSGVVKLTSTPARTYDFNPDWSPDGTKIAFERDAGASQEIFTMTADGADLQQITFDAFPGDMDPAWSPDGMKIAVVRFDIPAGRDGLYVMNADGSHPVQVTQNDARGGYVEPQWSPDGTKLVYAIESDTAGHAIFTINLDGTGDHQLTPWTLNGLHPDWSPDGRTILFEAPDVDNAPPGISGNVYTIRPDGSHLTAITHHQGDVHATNPAWSPDGKKIVFVQIPTGPRGYTHTDIFTMNADGSGLQQVTTSAHFDFRPDWGSQP
jgi:Tol biopolymer transport system component